MALSTSSTKQKLTYLVASFSLMAGTIAPTFAQDDAPDMEDIMDVVSNTSKNAFNCDTKPVSGTFSDVVAAVYPGVVKITIYGKAELPFGMELRNKSDHFVKTDPLGFGSGFVIDDKEGYIFTNAHVVEGALKDPSEYRFTASFYNPRTSNYEGEEIPVTLVGIDGTNDLAVDGAVVKMSPEAIEKHNVNLHCLPFKNPDDEDQPREGDPTLAIGAPFGLSFTVTKGIISNMNRGESDKSIGGGDSPFKNPLYRTIQTDVAVNPGNSGGPLFNEYGEVIGVNTSIYHAGTGASIGLSFAIPASAAIEISNQLITYGKIDRGWAGFNTQDLNRQTAEKASVPVDGGVIVHSVTPASPAGFAKILPDDVITSITSDRMGTNNISSSKSLLRYIAWHRPDDEVSFNIIRDGAEMTITFELGNRERVPLKIVAAPAVPDSAPSPHSGPGVP